MARDETLRGKLRRFIFKLYQSLKTFFDQIIDMIVIHFSKLSLCLLFLVSASKPNLFNAILFIFFLMLSLTSYRNIQKYWTAPIIFNAIILVFMYCIDVFQPSFIINLDTAMLAFIGLKFSVNDHLLFWNYFTYIFLLVIFVLTHYIIHSQKYEVFLETYQLLENKEAKIDKYT